MKSAFKNFKISALTFLPFVFLLFFMSCQDEETILVNPQPEETISPNSNLTSLLSRTSAFDGSIDDRLDYADCLALNLPVTITVNNITVTINTLDDIALIEDIINEFNTDDDILEFLFPISITLNDYSTVVINDQDELDAFVNECINEENVIECIDFVYPISFSIYNANFQILETVTINNDEELYGFVDYIEENYPVGIFASLNFPVTMIYANGDTIEVNNNQELEDAINAAGDDCATSECSEQEVDLLLMECAWNIVSYNATDVYLRYDVYFNENQNLRWYDGDTTVAIGGNWITSMSDDGVVITISNMTAFQDNINGEWLVVSCENDRFELINGQDIMILEQNCVTDFDCRNIQAYIGDTCQTASGVSGTINANCECEENNTTLICSDLEECYWYASTNLYDTFAPEHFYFGANNVVEIINGVTNQLEDAGNYWLNERPDGTQILTFSFQQVPHDLISLEWEIIACDEGVIEMVNGNDTLALSQECETFDCPDLQANFGDDCQTGSGAQGSINGDCDCEENITFDCPDIQANIGDLCFDNQNREGVVNADCNCEVENANPFECFESSNFNSVLTQCDTDNDGFAVFNLSESYENCPLPPDGTTFSFYLTAEDAVAFTNQINGLYTNITNPQTVYFGVHGTASGEIGVFPIELIVEDCNTFDCPDLQANIGDTCETGSGAQGVVNANCECEPNTNNPFVCFDEFTTITVCDEDDGVIDDAYVFNLDEFYAECSHINDINIEYYYSTADAENQTNQLTSPFVNQANPDVIFSRIEHTISGAYVIYEIVIFVETCNPEICSEEQLGQYLSQCTWNIEDFNGTDDLMTYYFDFSLDGTVLIEGDNQVITATWSTETIQGQVYITFDNVVGANIQAITGTWTVVLCRTDRIEIIRGTEFVYFIQIC